MTVERRRSERISFDINANYRVFIQKTLKKEELFYGSAKILNISIICLMNEIITGAGIRL